MMTFITLMFWFLGIAAFIYAHFEKRVPKIGILLGITLTFIALSFSRWSGVDRGRGYPETAEVKLSLGETYECIVGPNKSAEIYYAVVITGNGTILGLQFSELPPKNGVVSKTGGEIVFLPIAEQSKGVEIPNPLAKTPEKPAQ